MAAQIIRHLVRQIAKEARELRTRTDEAQVALQHVENLRQPLNPKLTDHPPEGGDTVVVLLRPYRRSTRLRILAHASELENLESTPKLADTLLAVEDGQPRLHIYKYGGKRHDGERR